MLQANSAWLVLGVAGCDLLLHHAAFPCQPASRHHDEVCDADLPPIHLSFHTHRLEWLIHAKRLIRPNRKATLDAGGSPTEHKYFAWTPSWLGFPD
jgi:hypothetical protein